MAIECIDCRVDELAGDVLSRPTPEEVEGQLSRMLRSRWFLATPKLTPLFEFLVREELARHPIEQSSISYKIHGAKLMEKVGNVRVYVKRLRTKINAYYASEGKFDPVLIVLRRPRGHGDPPFPPGMAYRPLFLKNQCVRPVRPEISLPASG